MIRDRQVEMTTKVSDLNKVLNTEAFVEVVSRLKSIIEGAVDRKEYDLLRVELEMANEAIVQYEELILKLKNDLSQLTTERDEFEAKAKAYQQASDMANAEMKRRLAVEQAYDDKIESIRAAVEDLKIKSDGEYAERAKQ